MRPPRSLPFVVLAAFTATTVPRASDQTAASARLTFQQLEPGLESASTEIEASLRAKITVVRVSLRSHRVGLAVPPRGENGKTLTEFQRLTGAKVTLSGGFMTSFLPPIPLGLVKQNGVVINRAASGDLLTGALAFKSGRPTIKPWRGFRADEWEASLQSGPLLLDEGRSALPDSTSGLQPSTRALIEGRYARAVVVSAPPDMFALLVSEPVSLTGLVNVLMREFGPRATAVNLSGATTAGLLVAVGAKRQTIGHDTLSLTNVIVVDGAVKR
jgi:hypothetical protein